MTVPAVVSPETIFNAEYFMNDGLYVSFQPHSASSTNLLSGFKVRNITRGAQTWAQTEVKHQLSGSSGAAFLSGLKQPGDITVEHYYDPSKAPIEVSPTRSSWKTAGEGWLFLSWVEETSGDTLSVSTFFACEANIAESGSFSGNPGEPLTSSTKFQLCGDPIVTLTPYSAGSSGV